MYKNRHLIRRLKYNYTFSTIDSTSVVLPSDLNYPAEATITEKKSAIFNLKN